MASSAAFIFAVSLNVVDEKELHLIGVKLGDDEGGDRDVKRGFWEENLRAEGGESRRFAASARLKRGRNMQMDPGGRYAAALGRREVQLVP